MKHTRFIVVIGGIALLALAVACAAPTPTPTPVPTATPTPPPPTPTPPPSPMAMAKMIYEQKCAACHGPNGEGTAAGPMVAGHSLSATKTQVRNPSGKMPAFPSASLSDSDLDKVAEFIASLGPAQAPVKEWEKTSPETMHHWMALLAIKNNDAQDARHHLEDALAFVKEPKHWAEMNKALDLIAAGKPHDAEHEIEEMAGSESPSGITMQRFHLTLAQGAVEAQNAAEVKHHLEHFLVKATESQKAIARKALDLAAKGDFHEAEHEIEELMKS